MITEIKFASVPRLEQGAVDMLLACHQRIRHFTDIAVRLASATEADACEIANAAEAVHRYYSVALTLHEADENDSVYPRLRRKLTDSYELESLQAMIDQHGPIDKVVARLLPKWEELKKFPGNLSSRSADLTADATCLQDLWRDHLTLEEEVVFPLIRRRLTHDDLQAIHAEMKGRRATSRD